MLKFTKLALVAAVVATTTAGKPFVPAQPLMAFMPLAIIEGGTVSTLPKGAKSHTGKVVVLRGRADRRKAAPARKAPAAAPATASTAASSGAVASARGCQCSTGGVSTGGSSSDVVELRNTDAGLRVMIIGPDGLTRTRYVAAPPGSTARLVLCLGSIAWAAGSIFMRNVPMPRSAFASNGIQMLSGGMGLLVVATLAGEPSRLDLAGASARALLSVLYLMVFGSLIAFTAYTYILRVSTPARVSTYAYVNPVVAVFLGWLFAGEPVTPRTLIATGVILLGIAVITAGGVHAGRRARQAAR